MPPLSRGLRGLRPATLPFATRARKLHTRNDLFKVSEEVQDALATGKPVVALETTIYTHGFPYPENVGLSSHLESLVRVNGGIPATIGILNGKALVGMQPEELVELVSSAGKQDTWKISRRDLGFIGGLGMRGRKMNGGTTIAGTMILAHLAGIKIFATGGLGGVHRGAENSMDISADLTELGRTPVTVISSGCKSFLDIPKTLEYLETQGVGVGTFADGREGDVDFPAFFSRDSGVRSPKVIADEAEAAAIVFAQSKYRLQSGLLFANPVPAESEVSKVEMDLIIEKALAEAEQAGMIGAANTPYVLSRIKALSGGRSVPANRALISANVIRGTKVAVELAKLELEEKPVLERDRKTSSIISPSIEASSHSQPPISPQISLQAPAPSIVPSPAQSTSPDKPISILVAGCIASDTICDYHPLSPSATHSLTTYTSNPALISQSSGGVGANVARAAHYAGATTILASVLANDLPGQTLLQSLTNAAMRTDAITVIEGAHTAQYVALNDGKRELHIAMADMGILSHPSLEVPGHWEQLMRKYQPRWVVIDANWSPPILSTIITAARKAGAKVAFEPVSNEKGARLFHKSTEAVSGEDVFPNHKIELCTPNIFELEAMYVAAREAELFQSPRWWDVVNHMNLSASGSRDLLVRALGVELVERGVPQMMLQLVPYAPQLVVKLGARGCLVAILLPAGDARLSSPEAGRYVLARVEDEKAAGGMGGVYMRLFPPAEMVREEDVVSVNGVGDTMLGVLMAGLVSGVSGEGGKRLEDVIPMAQRAAVMTLKSREAVSAKVKSVPRLLGAA